MLNSSIRHTIIAGLALSAAAVSAAVAGAPPGPETAANPAVNASNAFGLDLYRALAKAEPGRNLFISPYSMSIALTMAAEGARGQTEDEMSHVLRFPDGPRIGRAVTPVHQGYLDLANRFTAAAGSADPQTHQRITTLREQLDAANAESQRLDGKGDWRAAYDSHEKAVKLAAELNTLLTQVDRFDLRVANALWVEKSYDLNPAYTKTIDGFYGTGGVAALDIAHSTEASRQRINAWVEDHTEKRIKDLIPRGALAADTRLVITNAVYFMGQWASPFNEGATQEKDFTLENGTTIKARTMQDAWRWAPYAAFNGDGTFFDTPKMVPRDETKRPATYSDSAGFTMIELPYKGGDLSMVVIEPRTPQGLASLDTMLNAESLSTWLSKLEGRSVDTALPRFKMEWEGETTGTLQALGMKRAFVDPGKVKDGGAEFPGMSTSEDPAQQLFIGSVRHKAWVEVTEKGTEAAAATSIAMPTASAVHQPEPMVPFTPVFHADHPFLFLIRDKGTGVVLFVGRVTQP
jgi:serine protease inhibitor